MKELDWLTWYGDQMNYVLSCMSLHRPGALAWASQIAAVPGTIPCVQVHSLMKTDFPLPLIQEE